MLYRQPCSVPSSFPLARRLPSRHSSIITRRCSQLVELMSTLRLRYGLRTAPLTTNYQSPSLNVPCMTSSSQPFVRPPTTPLTQSVSCTSSFRIQRDATRNSLRFIASNPNHAVPCRRRRRRQRRRWRRRLAESCETAPRDALLRHSIHLVSVAI